MNQTRRERIDGVVNTPQITARNARRLRNKAEKKKLTPSDWDRIRDEIVADLVREFGAWGARRSKA